MSTSFHLDEKINLISSVRLNLKILQNDSEIPHFVRNDRQLGISEAGVGGGEAATNPRLYQMIQSLYHFDRREKSPDFNRTLVIFNIL
jgi:hypothetical protein